MKVLTITLAVLLIVIQSCKTKPNIEAEKAALLVLHNEQRKAHLEKNISLLFRDSIVDYIEVNRGVIKKPSYAESRKRFQTYFDAVDFIQWDDVTPPVFSFSDDGSMATSIVDKLVITRQKTEGNQLDTTHYAWLAVYKKNNGKWQLHRMGSTNR